MSTHRVRVRLPHNHKGLLILSGSLGIFYGIIVHYCSGSWVASLETGLEIMSLLLLGWWGWYMSRNCQHPGPVFLSGLLIGSCGIAAIVIPYIVFHPSGDSGFLCPPWYEDLLCLAAIPLGGAAIGLVYLLFRFIHVHFISQLIITDGTLCGYCGYIVAYSPSDRCPECGSLKETPIVPHGRVYVLGEFLAHRRWRRIAVILLGLIVLGVGYYGWYQYPFYRFAAKYEKLGGYQIDWISDRLGDRSIATYERLLLSAFYTTTCLRINLRRSGFFGSAEIEIRLVYKTNSSSLIKVLLNPAGALLKPQEYWEGDPHIVCRLNARQSRYVLENDIPGSLREVFYDTANQVGWREGDSAGILLPAREKAPTMKDVIIPAEEHFPR